MPTHYLVRCKCPGQLGTARVEESDAKESFELAGYGRYPSSLRHYFWAHCVRCWTCGRTFKHEVVKGRKSEHACGAKCLSSKGPTCECSCGGANHGKGWA